MLSLVLPAVPTLTKRRIARSMAVVRQVVRDIIRAHQAERTDGAQKQTDILTMLLQARDEEGQGMSAQQIEDEVMTFFLAGHETTALALTWTFYLLTQHPAALAQMQAEVDAVLGGRPPTQADLPRLPYTLQVLKESMRLYPPSSAIIRVALRDTVLGNRYPIRKNTTVAFSQYVLHRRPDTFPDPERFVPERFRPENEQALPRYAYVPFGAGPRICIGNYFSMMEGHLLLATIAQRLQITLLAPTPIRAILPLTLRPIRPVTVRVTHRAGPHGT